MDDAINILVLVTGMKLPSVISAQGDLGNAIKSALANKKSSLVGIHVMPSEFVLLDIECERNRTKFLKLQTLSNFYSNEPRSHMHFRGCGFC
jgi:hypothetical protein